MIEVKYKALIEGAKEPRFAKIGDAGADLVAFTMEYKNSYLEYGTGIAVEIPPGHIGLLMPRSSITNKDLMLKNGIGLVDENFRGELKVRFWCTKPYNDVEDFFERCPADSIYEIGDRIAQLLILPIPSIGYTLVDNLTESERGAFGFGSSGK